MIPFIDTNIFIRHVMADDPVQSPACLKLFQSIERGELTVWTSHLVIAEIVFVLSRVYRLERPAIRDVVLPLISLPDIKLDKKQLFDRVFEFYTTLPIDYVDAYHAALLEHRGATELYSYDTDFDRVSGVHRLTPSE